jgi:hypothetical protein
MELLRAWCLLEACNAVNFTTVWRRLSLLGLYDGSEEASSASTASNKAFEA